MKRLICSILVNLLTLFTYQAQAADMRDYFVGDFTVKGFDTSSLENYDAKMSISKNDGKFLKFSVEVKNIGTYYGFIEKGSAKNTLSLDYWNMAKDKNSATCTYENDNNNYPKIICQGSLTGNVGGDGVFVIADAWQFEQ